MARKCEILGVGPISGHNVSHSCRRTRRKFLPNLHTLTFHLKSLDASVRLRVAVSTLRSIEFKGGIEDFLLSTHNQKLTSKALYLKKQLVRSKFTSQR